MAGMVLFLGMAVSQAKPKREAASAPKKETASKPSKDSKDRSGFAVYTEDKAFKNHYIPSGWMGDYGDVKVNDKWKEMPHQGMNTLKFTYTANETQGAGWAGVFWQNPANNWGVRDGGFDLSGKKKLTFWARGDKGGEIIDKFQVGGITGEYNDSDSVAIGPVVLTNKWQEYTIDLSNADVSYISGGFCWVASKADNPEGATFYIDDIIYR